MHQETLERLCGQVKQQSEGYVEGFTGDLDAGIPPITRFQSVDDVEQIANNLELESGPGLTGTLVEMVGVFYELALNAVEHSEWAAGHYIIRADSRITCGGEITLNTDGILRIGVSFFDEALLIFNEIIEETGKEDLQLIYQKAPTMQSLKNLAPNRGLTVSETADGDWVISRAGLT